MQKLLIIPLLFASFAARPASALTLSPALAVAGIDEATPADLRGMARLNCSGALVALNRGRYARAVLLTNGHCARSRFLDASEVLLNVPYTRSSIYVGTANEMSAVSPSRVLYATMKDSDIALIELHETYDELERRGARLFQIAEQDPSPTTQVRVTSGYWRERQDCTLEAAVPAMKEGVWTWKDAFRLSEGCRLRGGYSGSPVVDQRSGEIVAVINTVNEGGAKCQLNSPCELLRDGSTTAYVGKGYAQKVTDIPACLDQQGEIQLERPGCKLPR